ncbi:MAG TPA: SPOR domain-containing protein [Halomonas sp.]|nr:SPOR domain-containing protein [Halomonas sp.]
MARRKQSSAKPAPRKRGATRTRKSRAARPNPRIPGWLWLLVGLVAGFLASQHQHGSAPWQDGSRTVAVIPATPSDATAGSAQDSKESGPTTPTFEFYTLLPETEVIAPGNAMPTSTATPPPPQPADGDTPADTRPGVSDSDPIAQIIAANTTAKSTSPATATPAATRTETSRQRTPESSGQRYMLQAASFRERGDASELSRRLGNFGLQTKISEVHTDDGATWHRVQSGPYSDRREVDRARDLMATRGITPLLIQLQN